MVVLLVVVVGGITLGLASPKNAQCFVLSADLSQSSQEDHAWIERGLLRVERVGIRLLHGVHCQFLLERERDRDL